MEEFLNAIDGVTRPKEELLLLNLAITEVTRLQAKVERLQAANTAAKKFYDLAHQIFGDPLILAAKYGPDFEPPTEEELLVAGQAFVDAQIAAKTEGEVDDE